MNMKKMVIIGLSWVLCICMPIIVEAVTLNQVIAMNQCYEVKATFVIENGAWNTVVDVIDCTGIVHPPVQLGERINIQEIKFWGNSGVMLTGIDRETCAGGRPAIYVFDLKDPTNYRTAFLDCGWQIKQTEVKVTKNGAHALLAINNGYLDGVGIINLQDMFYRGLWNFSLPAKVFIGQSSAGEDFSVAVVRGNVATYHQIFIEWSSVRGGIELGHYKLNVIGSSTLSSGTQGISSLRISPLASGGKKWSVSFLTQVGNILTF